MLTVLFYLTTLECCLCRYFYLRLLLMYFIQSLTQILPQVSLLFLCPSCSRLSSDNWWLVIRRASTGIARAAIFGVGCCTLDLSRQHRRPRMEITVEERRSRPLFVYKKLNRFVNLPLPPQSFRFAPSHTFAQWLNFSGSSNTSWFVYVPH